MARFDRETGTLVLRVVYDGPARAGKTTNLRALASSLPVARCSAVHTPAETARGSTLRYDLLEIDVGHIHSARGEHATRCELFSVPGQLSLAAHRVALLTGADAAVLVLDAAPASQRRNRVAVRALEALRESGLLDEIPLVLQANKQDVPGAIAAEALAAELDLPARRAFGAVAASGEGVRETFFAALSLARDAARPRLEAASIPAEERVDPDLAAEAVELRVAEVVERIMADLER